MRTVRPQMQLCVVIAVHIAALWTSAAFATVPKDSPKPKDAEAVQVNQTTSKLTVQFPQQLDLRSLQNMPLVILQPSEPIKLKLQPGGKIPKSVDLKVILDMIKSASIDASQLREQAQKVTREPGNRNLHSGSTPRQAASVPQLASISSQQPFAHRQGLLGRFRGSFSNMFPTARPFDFAMPTMQRPAFESPFFGVNPYLMAGSSPFQAYQQPWQQQQFQPVWNQFQTPMMGDLASAGSFLDQSRLFLPGQFGSRPGLFGSRPGFMGDLATSASSLFPRRLFPTRGLFPPQFIPNVPRHKPLFNNVEGLQGASMDISNAFADFTDSKEHGPEVSQKFGSVGHTINNFLRMMGFGPSSGFAPDDIGAYGGGGGFATMDATPIARSMDFYPGYGNQASLDHFDDLPIFEEDITEEFQKLHNILSLKNETGSEDEEEIVIKMKPQIDEMVFMKPNLLNIEVKNNQYVKAHPLKHPEDATERPVENYKIPTVAGTTENYADGPSMKQNLETQPIANTNEGLYKQNLEHGPDRPGTNYNIPAAQPLQTIANTNEGLYKQNPGHGPNLPMTYYKLPAVVTTGENHANGPSMEQDFKTQPLQTNTNEDSYNGSPEGGSARPVANYKIPATLATVPPQHRKMPVAIYQNADQQEAAQQTDQEGYVPAQSLSHSDGQQKDSEKLVNDDVIRLWVPVSTGEGYVEKRPLPIINILQASARPEGLKILQQIISGAARMVNTER